MYRNKPELLAPAGDPEKLESALHYGADAVYLAGEAFGLRTASRNFSIEDIEHAVAMAHAKDVKVYVTMNIVAHDADFAELVSFARAIEKAGVDAVIVSDPGIFDVVHDATNLDLHISTQASVSNAHSVAFWTRLGASRIVLAREMSLQEIRAIHAAHPDVELEYFVHGAMCMAISGRCLLSNVMTGRDANHGDCAQACRWRYHLVEEKRPGEYIPLDQDERGTYFLNAKDLCLIEHLPALLDAGITSLKIEGRVKSAYYVGTVVRAYRRALDQLLAGSWSEEVGRAGKREVEKTSHRPFDTGFLFKQADADLQYTEDSHYRRSYDFIGVVRAVDPENHTMQVEVRNRFSEQEVLEAMPAEGEVFTFPIENLNVEGERIAVANVAKQLVTMQWPGGLQPGDMLRKEK